jgi:hypothetical protein
MTKRQELAIKLHKMGTLTDGQFNRLWAYEERKRRLKEIRFADKMRRKNKE